MRGALEKAMDMGMGTVSTLNKCKNIWDELERADELVVDVVACASIRLRVDMVLYSKYKG